MESPQDVFGYTNPDLIMDMMPTKGLAEMAAEREERRDAETAYE